MRFTDKAADSYLPVPKGISPSVIGKVVTVQVMKKQNDYLQPESITKFVGVLKNYALVSNGFRFTLDGGEEKTVVYQNEVVEVILYSGRS